jgi:hypothetical protein
MAGYTLEQTTFFFSMLTNLAGIMQGTPGEIERFVAGRLDAHLQEAEPKIGVWTRAWGPAVYQAPLSNVADNVMFVVQNAGAPRRLVVAIAGTNTASAFDILIEDLFVGQQVPWLYGQPPPGASPRIAAGTFIGLAVLQLLTPGPDMPGANVRLRAFLERAGGPFSVTTTGHSLGGTLSIPLALWLADTQAAWDPRRLVTILCQPSAALTSGNGDFAEYYDGRLGSRTTRIYNSLDTIPHYWNDDDLARLPNLYRPDIDPDAVIDALVSAARGAAAGGDYTQINRATPPLNGTIQAGLIDPKALPFENYFAQAGYQHGEAYLTLMGIATSAQLAAAVNDTLGVAAARRAAARLRDRLRRRQAIS